MADRSEASGSVTRIGGAAASHAAGWPSGGAVGIAYPVDPRSHPVASNLMHRDRLAEIQRALAEDGRRRLALLRLPRQRSDRPADPRPRRSAWRRGAGSTSFPPRGEPRALVSAVEPGALQRLARARRASTAPGRSCTPACATLLGGLRPRRHAVLAAQRRALCRAGRRRDRRAGARAAASRCVVRRSRAALRGGVERRAVRQPHARGALPCARVVDAAFAEIGARAGARRPCSEGDMQRFILEQFAARGLVDPSSADRRRRRAQRRPALSAAGERRRGDRRRRFRPHRPVGQGADGRLRRHHLDGLRRRRGAGAPRARSSTSCGGRATPASTAARERRARAAAAARLRGRRGRARA